MDIYKVCLNTADTSIFVAVNGNDSVNDGSFNSPYASLEKALSKVSTSKPNVIIMPGSYTHSTDTDITVNGTKIIGVGNVEIDGSGVTTYGLKTVFGSASGTKEFTMKNISWDSGAKVGVQLQNTSAGAKINAYFVDCDFSADAVTYSSIDVDHASTDHAIRVYCTRCTTEGKVDFVAGNAGDRFRFTYGNLRGGLVTGSGDYDLEIFIGWSTFLLNGVTGGHANQRAIFAASVSETDADPNVYLEAVDADVQTQTPQVIAFDAP